MAELKPCKFGNKNCMCQFCEKQCNNGLNCSDCNYHGRVIHNIYLCTAFKGDLDAYINSWIEAKQNENQRARNMRWNDDGSCPVCGKYDNKDPFGSKVCPNCGAKMDQEVDND